MSFNEVQLDSTDNTPYEGFSQSQYALAYIEKYGQIDGGHHKAWVLDHVARILKNTPVIVSLASWSDGKHEYLINTGEPSKEYLQWVEEMKQDGEYDYDEGITP